MGRACILGKAAKRMYCIYYLVRAGISDKDIIIVYTSIIRSILEYACPVWHPGLTAKQTKDIERVQKRCLKLIYPTLSYSEVLLLSGLEELGIRRERITKELFDEIKHENHVLHSLLPKRNPESLRTRNPYPYIITITKPKDLVRHSFHIVYLKDTRCRQTTQLGPNFGQIFGSCVLRFSITKTMLFNGHLTLLV